MFYTQCKKCMHIHIYKYIHKWIFSSKIIGSKYKEFNLHCGTSTKRKQD